MAVDHVPASSEASEAGLSPDELAMLVEQAQREEMSADDARLSSAESFKMWMMSHPALRQMHIVDQFNQIGPAILEVLKRLLGI